jgi:hypothetical protein
MVSHHQRAVEGVDEPVHRVVRSDPQEMRREVVDDTVHRVEAVGREPNRVSFRDLVGHPERAPERGHGVTGVRRSRPLAVHPDREPAGEERQVLDQLVEVGGVALAHRLVLRLPVLPEHAAVDVSNARPAAPEFVDAVVELVEHAFWRRGPRAHEPSRRVPGGHGRLVRVPPDAPADGAALPRFDLALAHEPGVHAPTGGDGLPHLLGSRLDLEVLADLEPLWHVSNAPPPPR